MLPFGFAKLRRHLIMSSARNVRVHSLKENLYTSYNISFSPFPSLPGVRMVILTRLWMRWPWMLAPLMRQLGIYIYQLCLSVPKGWLVNFGSLEGQKVLASLFGYSGPCAVVTDGGCSCLLFLANCKPIIQCSSSVRSCMLYLFVSVLYLTMYCICQVSD